MAKTSTISCWTNFKKITCNGSEWSPDKAFEKLHEILINTLDVSLPKLDLARTGVQKTQKNN